VATLLGGVAGAALGVEAEFWIMSLVRGKNIPAGPMYFRELGFILIGAVVDGPMFILPNLAYGALWHSSVRNRTFDRIGFFKAVFYRCLTVNLTMLILLVPRPMRMPIGLQIKFYGAHLLADGGMILVIVITAAAVAALTLDFIMLKRCRLAEGRLAPAVDG
jgi:hypothetical protein